MLLEPQTLALVAALAAVAAIVGGVGGFGTGIILTAVLVPLIGAKAVVPVMAVAGAIINLGRFWFYRTSVDLRAVGLICASAIPFLLLGTWIYAVLDARTLGYVLAVVVLASVPLRRVLKRRQISLGTRGLVIGSGIFGLATGFATGTGVLMISLLLGAGYAGTTILATDALVSILIDVVKVAVFGKFDLLDLRAAALGALIGVVTIPGSALAAWLVNRMGARLHTLAIEALIIVGGLSMLWHASR